MIGTVQACHKNVCGLRLKYGCHDNILNFTESCEWLQNTQDINIVTKRYPPSKSSMVETFELWQQVFKRSLNRDNRNCAKFISLLTKLVL